MSVSDLLECARQALEGTKVDADHFFSRLAAHFDRDTVEEVTEGNLASVTWEDLEDCGVGRGTAKTIRNLWRPNESGASPTKVIVENNDPEVLAKSMSMVDLLIKYNPNRHDAYHDRLTYLADGRKFVARDRNGVLQVDASAQLFDQLDDFGERDAITVDGDLCTVYYVQDRPQQHANEHPLYPGRALLPGSVCKDTELVWSEVDTKSQQLLRIAVVETHELDPEGYNDVDIFEMAQKGFATLSQRFRKAAIRYRELDELDQLPGLKVTLGGRREKAKRPNQPFGVNTTT